MLIYIIITACSIGWLFLLIPSILYLLTSWKTKFENLESCFSDKALKLYFLKFGQCKRIAAGENLYGRFRKNYFRNYGRRHYIIPLILLGLIAGISIVLIGDSLLQWLNLSSYLDPLPPIAISALLGSYMWVAVDQVRRFRIRDFTAHDVYICSLRFLITIPLGFIFAVIVKDPIGIPLAFFLGTFPANTLVKFGRRFVNQKLSLGEQSSETKSELEQLQGINIVEAERYQGEGVTNIMQLAYADPVDLTIRTNFDFVYVVDCISQGLLWLYAEKNVDKLRLLGLRGAHEARVLYEWVQSGDTGQRNEANDNFNSIAEVLKMRPEALKKTLFEIAEDPYTEFIYNIWR